MNNYKKQANDFLVKTNTKMIVKFIEYDKYFMDDKEERDIFNITLLRDNKKYNFTFGQSINNSTGYGNKKPNSYDILSTLTKYDVGDFDMFCVDFGYNDLPMSKYPKILKIYNDVVNEFKMVCDMWNEKEIEELCNIN